MVQKKWRNIIVSFAPFWSLLSAQMPQNVLELGLKRLQETKLITSVHGTVYRSDGRVRRFLRTILPASTRIRTLSINVFERGSGDLIKSLWTNCPNVESLHLAGKPESVLTHSTKDSAAEVGCPTPRWLHINTSDVPQIPTLYARVEELLIESPTSLLEARVLQMIFKSAPNLRIIRLDQMDETQLEDPDVAADEPRVVAPDLKLLEILNSDWEKILWVLNRFQWSPSTSLKIQTWNGFIDHLCGDEVRAHVHAILRSMTDSSF
ncbi:hypothetical protein FRB90_009419, partial [Tulasnella sp. 427]